MKDFLARDANAAPFPPERTLEERVSEIEKLLADIAKTQAATDATLEKHRRANLLQQTP